MIAFVKKSSATDKVTMTLDAPMPTISPNELLVTIKAVGVGIHDEYFHAPDVTYPYTIGIEAAGIVQAIGCKVTAYKIGDTIAFISMIQPKGGNWAEYAAVSDQSLVLPIPPNMTFEQAAAIPVAANTGFKAMQGLQLKPNDTLFIAGGGGAIGSLLIQIAKSRKYKVIASGSAKNHQFMQNLGADNTIDYHNNDWQQQVKTLAPNGVDAAIAIHPGTPLQCQEAVKDSGVLVAVSGDDFTPERGIILKGVFNNVSVYNELIDLMNQIVARKLKLTVSKAYPFKEALTALEQVKTRHTQGRLVLTLDNK